MAKKEILKGGMRGGIDDLIRPTAPEQTPTTGGTEERKRVHCNSVMYEDIHQRMKITATRKGIKLAEAIEKACLMYLEKEEEKK